MGIDKTHLEVTRFKNLQQCPEHSVRFHYHGFDFATIGLRNQKMKIPVQTQKHFP
jgi:hypothetical protein